MAWKRAGAHIVSETIEGEVIIVNLLEGTYYSVTGCGTEIWQSICNGYSRADILQCLTATYDATPETLSKSLESFISELSADGIIEPSDATATIGQVPASAQASGKQPFVAPAIGKFSDMEDVLKMDPIHDFDESGWPNKP